MNTVFITGANRGIGLQLVKDYLSIGDRVIACCRKPDAAIDLQNLLKDFVPRLRVLPLNVVDPHSIKALVAKLKGESIDVLINNAGVYGPKSCVGKGMEEFAGPHLNDIDPADWLDVMHVNAIAPLMVTRAVLPFMATHKDKQIIMMSGVMASIQDKDYGGAYIYSSSKAALNMVGKTLSNEVSPTGITVTMIHPGWVQTDMGGDNAEITVADSAQGIISVINQTKQSGQFLNYDGTVRNW